MAKTRTKAGVKSRPAAAGAARAAKSKRPSKASRHSGAGSTVRGLGDQPAMVHLNSWIKANSKNFLPPVSNKQLFPHSADCVLFVSGGPNTRNDYHVNPTEELFYQLKGDVAVRIRPLDGSPPHDVIIREGELFLLPRWVPHRPQRPKGTLGLIVEFPRPEGELDGLRWYCASCDKLVYEAKFRLKKIDVDLHRVMNDFWDGLAERRTCSCGVVITRAGTIEVKRGKVRAVRKNGKVKK
ncbi:MAG: 3-hydroxyanthranilate 3,4-dioxygenase [Phycisphaerales bacterium]|nr:3-hydroxyanthranilate 3,4-dioxygenase [Phycisphaerales bacterium]